MSYRLPVVRRLACLLALLAALPAAARDVKLDYERYFEQLEIVKPFTYLSIAVRLLDDDGAPCQAQRVYLFTRQGTESLSFGRYSSVELPANPAWVENKARIIAQTEQDCEFHLDIAQRAPKTTELPYSELMAGLPEFRQLMERDAGLFSSPELSGIRLVYPGAQPATLTIKAKAGERSVSAAEGMLDLPVDETLLSENPTVVLSVLPDRILPLVN